MVAITSYDSRSGSQFLKAPANVEIRPGDAVAPPPPEPALAPDPFLELLAFGDDDAGLYDADIWRLKSGQEPGQEPAEDTLRRTGADTPALSGEARIYDIVSEGTLLARIFPDGTTLLTPPHEAALQRPAAGQADAASEATVPDRIARLRGYFEALSIPIRVIERPADADEPAATPRAFAAAVPSPLADAAQIAAAAPAEPPDENLRFLLDLLGGGAA